jgi:AraC-like DNA-binding protein
MDATADIISDVLRAVRLTGAIFFDVRAASPWASQAPPAHELAPLVIPGAQAVLEYHVITGGTCFARIVGDDDEPVRLDAGSIVVFPQGHPHVLSSAPEVQATKFDMRPYHPTARRSSPPFRLDTNAGGGEATHMICGFLGFDAKPFNPLVHALPKLLHVAGGYSGDGWLGSLITATVNESRQRRLGSSSILPKLSELIFIEVVRRHMESLPDRAVGWFAALRDPQVGRALQLIHQDARHPWDLATLARAVGVSRTLLVERFSACVGVAPMSYLVNWRMQLAAGLLAAGSLNIARIAGEVGYESEAAFSRAFKRSTGMPPAAWRSAANRPSAAETAAESHAAAPM